MSVQLKPFLSPQEYLAMERQADTKSEYYVWRGLCYGRRR